MSLPESAPVLRIDVHPSRLLRRALIVLHGGAVLCLLALPWPPWLALSAGLGAATAGYLHLRRLQRRRVTQLVCEQDSGWFLATTEGVCGAYHLLPDTYVHPRLTILNFAGPARRSVVLLPDSLDPAAFRRLRVLLKLRGARG